MGIGGFSTRVLERRSQSTFLQLPNISSLSPLRHLLSLLSACRRFDGDPFPDLPLFRRRRRSRRHRPRCGFPNVGRHRRGMRLARSPPLWFDGWAGGCIIRGGNATARSILSFGDYRQSSRALDHPCLALGGTDGTGARPLGCGGCWGIRWTCHCHQVSVCADRGCRCRGSVDDQAHATPAPPLGSRRIWSGDDPPGNPVRLPGLEYGLVVCRHHGKVPHLCQRCISRRSFPALPRATQSALWAGRWWLAVCSWRHAVATSSPAL